MNSTGRALFISDDKNFWSSRLGSSACETKVLQWFKSFNVRITAEEVKKIINIFKKQFIGVNTSLFTLKIQMITLLLRDFKSVTIYKLTRNVLHFQVNRCQIVFLRLLHFFEFGHLGRCYS